MVLTIMFNGIIIFIVKIVLTIMSSGKYVKRWMFATQIKTQPQDDLKNGDGVEILFVKKGVITNRSGKYRDARLRLR